MTYFFNYRILCIKKTRQRNGQKAASFTPSARKATAVSLKNLISIAFTVVAAKVYNPLLLSILSDLKLRKLLGKIKMAFREINHNFTVSEYPSNH